MRTFFVATVLAATTMLSQTAMADALADIKKRGTIRIAIDLGAPPYGQLDASAKPSGSDVEAANMLARDLGVALEIVPVTGPNRVPFLLTNKADVVMASFSITDERKKVIDYSAPYGVVPTVIGAPKSMDVPDFAALSGKTVAVARGTTSDQALSAGAAKVKGVNIVRYEDDATTNTAVATGQQDLIAAAASVIGQVNIANPSRNLEIKYIMSSAPYAIGIRKNEPELKNWLDKWVSEKTKSGEINEVYKRHFGIDLPEEYRAN